MVTCSGDVPDQLFTAGHHHGSDSSTETGKSVLNLLFIAPGPWFESGISHTNPDTLQDHRVVK